MRDDNGLDPFLASQLETEAQERISRRRRQRDAAMLDGSYPQRFGSYSAGHGFTAVEITDEEKKARRAARDKQRAYNRARGLPQDTPIPPPHLLHTNRRRSC